MLINGGYLIGQSILLIFGAWLVPHLTGGVLPLAPLVPSLGSAFSAFEAPTLLMQAVVLI